MIEVSIAHTNVLDYMNKSIKKILREQASSLKILRLS